MTFPIPISRAFFSILRTRQLTVPCLRLCPLLLTILIFECGNHEDSSLSRQHFKSSFSKWTLIYPNTLGGIAAHIKQGATSINQFITSMATPSEQLVRYLDLEFEHVHGGLASPDSPAMDYYKGINDNWGPYQRDLDIKRKVSDELIIDTVLEPSSKPCHFVLLKGYAGSGKSAVLRRFCWDAATQYSAIVFWLKEGGLLRPNMVRELYNLINRRFIVVIEDLMVCKDEVLSLLEIFCKAQHPT